MVHIPNHHKEQINLIRKLAEEGDRFVNSSGEHTITELDYLIICNQKIFEYFLEMYGENFIFSSFSYLNHENKFTSVPYLFYSGAKYEEVKSSDYWKAVSWNTNNPNSSLILQGDLSKIINDNYKNKNIGLIKELIWYLINVLIPNENVLTVTELLLHYGRKDPRNLIIYQESKSNKPCQSRPTNKVIENNEGIDRYFRFRLNDFEIEKISNLRQIVEHKVYLNIPNEVLQLLQAPVFKYVGTNFARPNIDPSKQEAELGDERIQSFKKLLNIYKQISFINPFDEYNFYFLRPITSYQDFRGVFLFGFNEKLRPLDILFIENLNYRILSDVMIKRIKTISERELDTVKTQLIFSVGHFLKHKTNRVPALLTKVKVNIRRINISDEKIKRLINRDLETAKLTSERVHKLALIIDIIAKSMGGKNYYLEADITNKTEYYTTKIIDLKQLIQKVHKDDYEDSIELNMNEIQKNIGLEIEPFIFNKHISQNILPSELFYEEIITEIFENCKSKAKMEENRKNVLKVRIETIYIDGNQCRCLVLSNKLLNFTQFEDLKSFIPKVNQFTKVTENLRKISGIIFLDTFLKSTGSGFLLFKRSLEGENYFFSVALKLENLKIIENDKHSTN